MSFHCSSITQVADDAKKVKKHVVKLERNVEVRTWGLT